VPAPLTEESILDTAEEVLRRYGPAKTTVVDVARALDVSHGSVYRHFSSKAALRDAVTRRWLDRISAPLDRVVHGHGDPTERLRTWVRLLADSKQGIAREDPPQTLRAKRSLRRALGILGACVPRPHRLPAG
jgi:AcrR family transcriptional regulator